MKLLALALCLCLVAIGWPVATLASASADVSAAPGSVAASTPAPSPSEAPPSGDETSPDPSGPPPAANGSLMPPAPRAGTVTVSTWWDLKAEVEDPDGAPVILVGSALTAKDKFDSATGTFIAAGTIAVTRRVTIQSAAGGPFTITRSDRPFEEFFTAFFKVTAGGELTLQYVTLDGNRGQIPVPANESLVVVDNGILTLGDGAVLKNNSSKDNGGGVNVRQGALTMSGTAQIGGTGEANTAPMGGGVFVTGAGSKLTITGGKIIGNKATGASPNGCGGGVAVEGGATFDMSGGSIQGNTSEQDNGGGVAVRTGAQFTLSGTAQIGGGDPAQANKAENLYSGGGVFVDDATFTMLGGSVMGNTAHNGGGVFLWQNRGTASFIMRGGSITNNESRIYGGGVYMSNGTFNMTGGSITGNEAPRSNGGGVYVWGGTFNMSDGGISGNTANRGSGVYLDAGTLNLSGTARIDGNTAYIDGGGVYAGYATFNMQGGSITGNRGDSLGGGVFVDSSIFTMTDGRITGNTAGGGAGMAVYLSNPANDVEISGGLLSAQGGSAILIAQNKALTVSGGAVMQTDKSGTAIYYRGDYADQVKVTNSGTVYSRGKVVEYENTALTFPGPSGDGLVILQTGSHAPYAVGAGTDLTTDPAGAAAKWAVEGGTGGVRYENGANVGFLPLGVAVGQEAPPQPDNYSVRTLRDDATGVEVTAYCAPNAVLTVIKDHLHDKGACAACDAIRQSGAPAAAYDISIEGGYSGCLDLALPLGQGRDGQEVLVRHCKGSQVEDMTLTAGGGYVRGTFSSLSPFAVFGKASSSSSSSSSGSSSSSNSSSSQSASSSQGGGSNSSGGSVPGSSRPQTNGSSAGPMFWIWYVLGAVAVLVIAGALVLHKRYRGSGPKG